MVTIKEKEASLQPGIWFLLKQQKLCPQDVLVPRVPPRWWGGVTRTPTVKKSAHFPAPVNPVIFLWKIQFGTELECGQQAVLSEKSLATYCGQ